MKTVLTTLLFVALGWSYGHAQLSPYDENSPVGWASVGTPCTGSSNRNPVVVTTEDELRAAMQQCKGGKNAKTC